MTAEEVRGKLGIRSGKTVRMKCEAVALLEAGMDVLIVAHKQGFASECKDDILGWCARLGLDVEPGRVRVTDVQNVRRARAGWQGAVRVDHHTHGSAEGHRFMRTLAQQIGERNPLRLEIDRSTCMGKYLAAQREHEQKIAAMAAAEYTALLTEADGRD